MGGDVSQTFPISLVICLKNSLAGQLAKQLLLLLRCLLEDCGGDRIVLSTLCEPLISSCKVVILSNCLRLPYEAGG